VPQVLIRVVSEIASQLSAVCELHERGLDYIGGAEIARGEHRSP
jgi:hypothetical protein